MLWLDVYGKKQELLINTFPERWKKSLKSGYLKQCNFFKSLRVKCDWCEFWDRILQ